MDTKLTISEINEAFTTYAAHPENSGSTRTLKGKLNQKTMEQAFVAANEALKAQQLPKNPKDLKQAINALQGLHASIKELGRRENQISKGKPAESILYKTNKIADFFRKLFNPLFRSQREKEVSCTRAAFKMLENTAKEALENLENSAYLKSAKTALANDNVNRKDNRPRSSSTARLYRSAVFTKQSSYVCCEAAKKTAVDPCRILPILSHCRFQKSHGNNSKKNMFH